MSTSGDATMATCRGFPLQLGRREWLATAVSRHLQSSLTAIAAAGWLFIATHNWFGVVEAAGGHDGHTGHHGAVAQRAHPGGGLLPLWMAFAMVATMAVLVGPNAHYAAMRSPRRRRPGAAADVLAGWAAVWLAAMLFVTVVVHLAVSATSRPVVLSVAVAVASGWQVSRWRRARIAGCHRLVLPSLDPHRARRCCRRYGLSLGVNCSLSCGPMMAAMMAADHSLLLGAPVAALSWWERFWVRHDDPRNRFAAATLVIAGASWLLTGPYLGLVGI